MQPIRDSLRLNCKGVGPHGAPRPRLFSMEPLEAVMKESRRRDDIRNLSLVWGAGITAGILTLALLLRGEEPQQVQNIPEPEAPVVAVEIPEIEIEPIPPQEPVQVQVVSGSNRLFGTVVTVRGDRYEGFIQWDRNEGSWADLLDANKTGTMGYAFRTSDRASTRGFVISMERDRDQLERDRARAERDRARLEREIAREAREMERNEREIERAEAERLRALEELTRQGMEAVSDERAEAAREEAEELAERVQDQAEELRERLRDLDLNIQVDVDPEATYRVDGDGGIVVVSGSKSGNVRIARPNVSVSVARPKVSVKAVRPVAAVRAVSAVRPVTSFVTSASTQSGIRFGHIDRIQALDSRTALFTLRSGEQMELRGSATDLGSGMRALIVEQANGRRVEMDWGDVDYVDFYPAPEGVEPTNYRMYGTMTTDSGMEFTGYVTWDVDEIYSDDILDGDDRGYDREIPFGQIERIERYSSRSALVTLADGSEVVLDGSNDVDSSNSGISVSDPMLGQVKVSWNEFEAVTFHPAENHAGWGTFDGGTPLNGTVVMANGEELSGRLIWDQDEAFSWEMLNGHEAGVEFHVEFGNIAKVERNRRSTATVTLVDGRTFELGGSNDVDTGNKGVVVETGDESRLVSWNDIREVRFAKR